MTRNYNNFLTYLAVSILLIFLISTAAATDTAESLYYSDFYPDIGFDQKVEYENDFTNLSQTNDSPYVDRNVTNNTLKIEEKYHYEKHCLKEECNENENKTIEFSLDNRSPRTIHLWLENNSIKTEYSHSNSDFDPDKSDSKNNKTDKNQSETSSNSSETEFQTSSSSGYANEGTNDTYHTNNTNFNETELEDNNTKDNFEDDSNNTNIETVGLFEEYFKNLENSENNNQSILDQIRSTLYNFISRLNSLFQSLKG